MKVGFTRRNIGRLLLLGWAVALAWLARRQFYQGDSADTISRTRRLAPDAQYFAVYAGARQIGQLNLTVDTTVDGVRLTEVLVVDLPLGDSTHQLARSSVLDLSRSLRLRGFTRNVFGVGQREELTGQVGTDSIISISNLEGPDGGPTVRMRARIPPEATLPVMLPYRAAFSNQLHVGGRFVAPLLDLSSAGTRPIIVKVTAESTFIVADSAAWDSVGVRWAPATSDTLRAWRLEHDAGGAPTVSWIDETGGLVHQETAGGLTLVRSAFEIVRNNYRYGRTRERSTWRRDIPGMLALSVSRYRPDTSAQERWFVLVPDGGAGVTGPPHGLAGGRQSLRSDTVIVTRETPPDTAQRHAREARNNLGLSWETPLQDDEMARAASSALSGAGTLRDSVQRLTTWVAREIATDPGEGATATAGPTLRMRRGNADGKARLLATLAKVSGIPARIVAGLAVLPQGTFAHAWTEIWVGGWIAADPTYGHFPASASLVRLRVGERSHVMDLLPTTASARFLPIRKPL
jgi:transglutaminase-like putative cysteine protease